MKKLKRVMVANRGEIALRVIRSVKESGRTAIAIYSEVDAMSPHVKAADEAYEIGPATASQSYLNISRIIETAIKAQVDGIHPGYGFLSENAEFAKAVADAGITFIGPSAHSINIMGDKLSSKAAVKDFDVPLLPGSESAIEDIEEGKKIASDIGYPVLIKASAGGGGKGMRIVEEESQFVEQMNRAVSEAQSAFGDGRVFIEKFAKDPKHIEFQILRDSHGNTVHLFERECSIQRRHQKVVEEAPSPVITEALRKEMGEAAKNAAVSCDYLGAGTVEFIFDADQNFYFLEMNTRLQVEHPVTEMITGVDLVMEQLRIAEGLPISFQQEDLKINGHSIEVRVYAENPFENFLPDTGTLRTYKIPSGNGVRVDDGFEEGMEVSVFYDPMIAKLITYGADRETAIQKMLRAMEEYEITGVITSIPFCQFVLEHEEFRNGAFTTGFVGKYWNEEALESTEGEDWAAVLAANLYENQKDTLQQPMSEHQLSQWKINRKR